MAAAAVLIIASGLFIYSLIKKRHIEPVTAKTETDINKLAPEYAPQMNQFAKMIDIKQEELKALGKRTARTLSKIHKRY